MLMLSNLRYILKYITQFPKIEKFEKSYLNFLKKYKHLF